MLPASVHHKEVGAYKHTINLKPNRRGISCSLKPVSLNISVGKYLPKFGRGGANNRIYYTEIGGWGGEVSSKCCVAYVTKDKSSHPRQGNN